MEMQREPMAARILAPITYTHTTSMTGPDRRHHLTTEATSIRSTLSRKRPCPSRIADPCGEDCESRWLLGQSVSIKPQTRHNATQFTLPFLNAGFQLPKWMMVHMSHKSPLQMAPNKYNDAGPADPLARFFAPGVNGPQEQVWPRTGSLRLVTPLRSRRTRREIDQKELTGLGERQGSGADGRPAWSVSFYIYI